MDKTLLAQLNAACGTPQQILNGSTFLRVVLKNLAISPQELSDHCNKFGAQELSNRLLELASEMSIPSNEIFLKNFTDEKTINNLMKTLKKGLNTVDFMCILADTQKVTFEVTMKELFRSKDLSRDLDKMVEILFDIGKEELAAEIKTFKTAISKLSGDAFEDQLFIFLNLIDVDLSNLILGLKDILFVKNIEMPILASEGAAGRFHDLYVDLMVIDDVDKVTTHEERGQLELENFVKRSGPYLKEYVSNHASKGCKLMEILKLGETKRLVLIGNPGTGKSVYCKKIVHMFIDNELPHRWALLMTCRNTQWQQLEDPKNRFNLKERLEKFIEAAIEGYENWKAIKADIMSTEGLNLLLIIDGLDEFPIEHFEQSLLSKILRKDILPKCSLLLTSRVGAFNEMMKKYQFEVKLEMTFQVVGFSKAQRDEYIKKRLGRRQTVYDHLSTVLTTYGELHALSLIPINIDLIISLIEEPGSSQKFLSTGHNTLIDAYKDFIIGNF